jgi:hypothetical protein
MFRLLVTGVLVLVSVASADPVPASVRAHAVRLTGAIAVDGHLDEPAWRDAPKQTGFTQRQPKDGVKASFSTSFAVLYDDDAIYVGVWADDPEPHNIRALLTRRDVDAPADAVAIAFDSYHDRRTAYMFQLNAAGVQRDMLLFDDTNSDDTWDAVWTGNVARTDRGWTAEFRIPLNQLRFAADDLHEWGLQVIRFTARTQEQSTWSPWPRTAPEIVSKFGVVDGIDHLKQARRLEVLPYVTGGVDVAPIDAGDPLNSHVTMRRGIGADIKYGLGPAFTLSATINPDFGQVEADPSQITLGPYELFYPEKRPFFLEGIDLFKLPIGNNGDNSPEGAFYSRRIGAAPPNQPDTYNYINWPTSTTIYGAMKLTGKTRSGWSVGLLDAVTGGETASIVDTDGVRTDPIVAVLTNYAVGRVKRDLNDGKTSIGLSTTAVNRDLGDTPVAATLHDQAYTGGLQFQHKWDDNAWQINFRTNASWIHGTPEAIAATQTDPNHLFQRPDSADSHFDPTRTSMSGFGATWFMGPMGDTKHWSAMFGGDMRSPGLELNDLGFQTGGDRAIPFLWGQYHDETPGDHVLSWNVSSDIFAVTTFEPVLDDVGLESNGNVQLANYWSFFYYTNLDRARWNQVALRGGPALRVDPQISGNMGFNTDNRKPVVVTLRLNGGRAPASDTIWGGIDAGVTIQARSNIDIFVGPSVSERDDPMQYVDEVDDQMGAPHYVFAHVKQTTASLTFRMNWTFSPHLTLQAYAQPFIASGRYSELKDVDNPHADRFADRFHILSGNEYAEQDGTIMVSRNGSQFSFDKPDFDFRQLRSTLVVRWEYRPGSTVFAIWSHGRTNQIDDGRFRLGHDLAGLADASGENVVMVKVNYWVGL